MNRSIVQQKIIAQHQVMASAANSPTLRQSSLRSTAPPRRHGCFMFLKGKRKPRGSQVGAAFRYPATHLMHWQDGVKGYVGARKPSPYSSSRIFSGKHITALPPRRGFLTIALLLGALTVGLLTPPTLAQVERPRTADEVEEFDPDAEFERPLEFRDLEPLLPDSWPETPLTAEQKRELEIEIAKLEAIAAQQWLAEAGDEAFDIWYRTLRLHQALDRVSEVQALGRIGELAWEADRPQDVQVITRRLETIETENPERPLELTAALAKSDAQVRLYPNAVRLYEEWLVAADATGDLVTQERILLILAELHRNWFRFEEAIAANLRLLALAQNQFDVANMQTHRTTLVYLYEETAQWTEAIAQQEALFESYLQKEGERLKLAPLRLAIGRNHDRIGEGEAASAFFQQAFDLAWLNQQYALASDALTELAELYVRNGQPDTALTIYQEQLKATDYAYDQYRKMTTFDRLGQLYLELQDYREAIAAFEAGRAIAVQLGHREAYFEDRIQAAQTESFDRF
ncbi:MAG: tetratricopeptide repeat protein [Spirulina sp. SIO3F2]|nr:tetratricopeptide repeat protein [Spirulina sp. SIO3F2]